MKRLILLRHGKADPDRSGVDHARELTDRGRRNSATMGERILDLAGLPDAIVTSDAARAQQTAELAANAMGFTAPLTIDPGIYLASAGNLVRIVKNLPDHASNVVLVGHNPGFHDLANWSLSPAEAIGDLPTAGVVVIDFDIDDWSDLAANGGTLLTKSNPRDPA